MAVSIYELINKNIDYKKEYIKIKRMFLGEYLLTDSVNTKYTYSEVFNHYILKWKYRGPKCSLKEIMTEIEKETNCGENNINDCLYLCELILNIREFLKWLKENYLTDCKLNDEMLLGNINYILNELGYSIHKEEEYKVLLIKKDADIISTAMMTENVEISNLIMQYNDFKIVKDIKAKQRILYNLANYLEVHRKDLKEKNAKLEQNLFMAFNKLNVRHNNLAGKEKEEYTANLNDEELIKWYDKIYNLILIAIRMLELPNVLKPFEEIRTKYFDNKSSN